MPWYYFGTALVFPTFLGIFYYPEFINKEISPGVHNESMRMAWYVTAASVFNVGWAAVQIANMSIVNNLTTSTTRRDMLSNSRNGFTAIANMTVLGTALITFAVMNKPII